MKSNLIIILFSIPSSLLFGQKAKPFVLINSTAKAEIIIAQNEPECVQLAVADLVSDIQKISGKTLDISQQPARNSSRVVIRTQRSQAWESYQIKTLDGNLYITGSDERGTMFGIYHFIEHYLGVDPMYFWNDVAPNKKSALVWQNIFYQSTKPTFKFRGWFINDEDLLTEWYASSGKRNIDYPFYQQVVSPAIMKKVCETAVRMRFNLMIPASFIDIMNPDEAALVNEAAKRGLFLSMHHVEPMGVSAFTYFNYWKQKDGTKPLFSYFSNRDKIEEVWRVYANEWAKYPKVIWQIGLRGIGDRPMWLADPNTPQTDADRGRLISAAMAFQMQLIGEVDKRVAPPVTTTLWAEGSNLNEAGFLNIPDNVMVIFADNSPGWRWQSDFFQTKRQPEKEYGVYYHHQLWSSGPHLLPIVSPAKTQSVLSQAVEKGDTAYCIMNVSNIREYQLGIAASAQMLWNFKDFNPQTFNGQWFSKYFGKHSKVVQDIYQDYFDCFQLNDKTGTPILMDGQINSLATELLNELKLQLSDSVKYQALLKKKSQETEETKWIKTAIGDMLSGGLNNKALLAKLIQQKQAHLTADSLATLVLPRLSKAQQQFFQTDFMASAKLIIGLETWLEKTLQAKMAADANTLSLCKDYLQQAKQAFSLINQGKELKSENPKWEQWYRGDKKMNLKRKEMLTKEVEETLK
jgi:hypothetical protein